MAAAEEAVPPLAEEIRAMKPSARKKRALAAGATEEEVEDAGDEDDPVAAYVALISRYEQPPSAEDLLRAELDAMKPSARKKRAISVGATEDQADDAGDEDDPVREWRPRAPVCFARLSAATARYHLTPTTLQVSAFVQLILACEQKARDAARKEQLAAELKGMKPSGRRKRAIAAGATEDEAEDAGDADDVISAFVALLMEKEGQQQAAASPSPTQVPAHAEAGEAIAHHGGATLQEAGNVDEGIFEQWTSYGKHVMLS